MKATMSRNVTPSFIKDNLQPTTSLIEIKDHTINWKFNLFLLLCFEGKKVSQPTVPCLSGRNIHANRDLDASGVYWIRSAGALASPQGYCDQSAVGRKFIDQSNKVIMNAKCLVIGKIVLLLFTVDSADFPWATKLSYEGTALIRVGKYTWVLIFCVWCPITLWDLPMGYFLVIIQWPWGCANRWSHILTSGLTIS